MKLTKLPHSDVKKKNVAEFAKHKCQLWSDM